MRSKTKRIKTPEIHYLQHKTSGNILIIETTSKIVRVVYLENSKLGKLRKLKKVHIRHIIESSNYYHLQRKELARLLTKHKIPLDIIVYQGLLFVSQLSIF
jgi:hypothetical protein